MTIKRFEDVRNWGKIRGIDGAAFQRQYQRFLQEAIEIHEAYNDMDMDEVADAIGDTIVTLINLAKTVDMHAEDCLDQAFGVIEHRKGLTFDGDFVRYAKLNDEHKAICDAKQGQPGDDYFHPDAELSPEDFTV